MIVTDPSSFLLLRLAKRKDLSASDREREGRPWKGYDPFAPQELLCEINRKEWRLGKRAFSQNAVMFVYHNIVVAMMTIDNLEPTKSGRWSIVGRVIQRGNPLYKRYVGREAPVENRSMNPVSYYTQLNDEEIAKKLRPIIEYMGGVIPLIKWIENATTSGLLSDNKHRR